MVSVVITVYANFDVSMLGFLKSDHEVGLYNAASKIKFMILSLSTAVTSVLVPRIGYHMQRKEQKQVDDLLEKSLRISLVFCVPVTIYATLFAEQVLHFLCGPEFRSAAATMRILTLCVIPLVLTSLFGNQILIPLGMEKRYSQSVFVGMWINLGLNLLLIPLFGPAGAAVGTLTTEVWNAFWMSKELKYYRQMFKQRIRFRGYLLPLVLGSVVSLMVNRYVSSVNVFFQLVFTALPFFGCYYVIQLVRREPLLGESLRNVLQRLQKK